MNDGKAYYFEATYSRIFEEKGSLKLGTREERLLEEIPCIADGTPPHDQNATLSKRKVGQLLETWNVPRSG